jgi:hypothetical protein
MMLDIREPCVLIGGPFDGMIRDVACIAPSSPCERILMPSGVVTDRLRDHVAVYAIALVGPYTRETDSDGRWVYRYHGEEP